MVDNVGGEAHDTIFFTAITNENQLPVIEITSPLDSSIIQYGSDDPLAIEASDPDGSISSVKVYLNGSLSFTFRNTPYTIGLNRIGIGDYVVVAEAMDDREGIARDTIFFSISDSTVSSVPQINTEELLVYPNPAKNMLHFNLSSDYEIYTLTGQKILKGTKAFQVDISELVGGLFVLKTDYGVYIVRKD